MKISIHQEQSTKELIKALKLLKNISIIDKSKKSFKSTFKDFLIKKLKIIEAANYPIIKELKKRTRHNQENPKTHKITTKESYLIDNLRIFVKTYNTEKLAKQTLKNNTIIKRLKQHNKKTQIDLK